MRGHRSAAGYAPALLKSAPNGMLLPCVPAPVALVQSAPHLSFRELVVAADHLIKMRGSGPARRALHSREELDQAAQQSRGRGVRRLRAAIQVARVGAESRMESLQHFELAKLGLDTLELQGELYDAHGNWIGRFDSLDREKHRILEFDGEQHRTDRAQYLKDVGRLDRARQVGYDVMRTHREDFQPAQIGRTRVRLCEFLGEAPRAVPANLVRYFAEPY